MIHNFKCHILISYTKNHKRKVFFKKFYRTWSNKITPNSQWAYSEMSGNMGVKISKEESEPILAFGGATRPSGCDRRQPGNINCDSHNLGKFGFKQGSTWALLAGLLRYLPLLSSQAMGVLELL